MVDRITQEQRSANMRAIRHKDTAPEMTVRRMVHGLGLRYRLHRNDLPGKPDLVFGPIKRIVFVHGCYWHGHGCKIGGTGAKSNQAYWGPKIQGNRDRDARHLQRLKADGWKVLTLWECEVKLPAPLKIRLSRFLGKPATGKGKNHKAG